jgi:hypothetical protein
MVFREVFSPNNLNTPLVQIIIPKPDAQQTLINTLNIQVDPFINPPNILIDDKLGILHWSRVWAGPHIVINTSAPQVAHPNPSNPKATRLE